MPSIKCDICGGNIIMQANKTGVCQNCGLEYDIKAIKAMVSKGTTEKSFVKSGNQKQDDVDRDCLLIYLNDLRVMETVMQCSRRNAEQLLDRSADNEAIVKQLQQTLEERESHLEELNKPVTYTGEGKSRLHACIGCIVFSLIIMLFNFTGGLIMLGLCGLAMLCLIPIFWNDNVQKTTDQNSRKFHIDFITDEISDIKTRLNTALKEYNKNKPEIESLLCDIETETKDISELLSNAYSANIIPMQFRNIEGVYYLYDYLSMELSRNVQSENTQNLG